jgi:acid phosphatase
MRPSTLLTAAAVAAATATALAGCAPGAGAPPAVAHEAAHRTGLHSEPISFHRSAEPVVSKLLVIVEENHSFGEMAAGMPFLRHLATRYAYAGDYHATFTNSLPNYLIMIGGAVLGEPNDLPPSDRPIYGTSVFGQALRAGRTVKVYAEGMPTPCATENGGNDYVVRHNPWPYFVEERSACLRDDVSTASLDHDALTGRLPNAGMVIPNLVHDAHDGTLAQADSWLARHVTAVMRGPDWRSGRLAIVITADEDDGEHGNRVLTVVASRYGGRGVVSTPLDHFSIARLYEEVLGVPPLRDAASAASMARAFGLPVSGGPGRPSARGSGSRSAP